MHLPPSAVTPPRKPGALTLSTLSRLGGRVACGLALVWMLALVGWPEKHERLFLADCPPPAFFFDGLMLRDDSPAVLLGKLLE